MITLGHVENEWLIRDGFAAWVRASCQDIEVAGSAATVAGLIGSVAAPQVVVLDAVLGDGTTLTDNLRELRGWGSRVVVSTNDGTSAGLRITAYDEDACAFVDKDDDPAELLLAIRHAAAGQRYLTAHWRRFLEAGYVRVSPRQEQAARLYADGLTYAAGAGRMGISEDMFRQHIERVRARYRQAGRPVDGRAQLREQLRRDGYLIQW